MTPVETAVPAVSADVSSAPSLGESIGELFGDFTGGGESPEPTDSAEGSTPSEPADGSDTDTTSEVAPTDTDTASTLSDGTTPSAAEPVTDEDPFKDTTAATFVVNGQTLSNEDIRVFKEGGAVIRPEALPNILSKLAEREQLSARARTRDAEYQTLSKVSEWHDQSSGKTFTGPEAAIEMRIGNAALLAENQLLVDTLTDPDKLYSILTTEQVPDGKGGLVERVIINPAALQTLQRENALTQRELAATIRDHYKTVIATASRVQPAPVNYEAATPGLVAEIAKLANLDATVLTAADRKLLADHLPEHTSGGLASVKWQNWAKQLMTDRAAQKASTQQLVTSTTDATKKGLANMAAAARGMKQTPKPAVAPKPVSPQQERADNEGDLFDLQQRAAANAMRQRA